MEKLFLSYSLEELAAHPDFRDWVLRPTLENEAFWQDFQKKYPEKSSLIQEAKNLVKEIHTYFDREITDPQKLEEYFKEINRRVNAEKAKKRSKIISPVFSFKSVAAVASILLMAGIAGWFWLGQQVEYQIYKTGYGEWETVSLPDGSTVKLNANSELKLINNWAEENERKVWLKGEAFFEIEKKTSTGAKFFVIANDISVEVLGTSFNVNNRGEKTEVFLTEGKIKLEADSKETYMVPGDFIAYSSTKKEIIENRKNVNDLHDSWKDGVLIMQTTSVKKILDKIEELYGVTFLVEDSSLLESKTTVRIPMDKFDITLPILQKTLGVNIEKKEEVLIVK